MAARAVQVALLLRVVAAAVGDGEGWWVPVRRRQPSRAGRRRKASRLTTCGVASAGVAAATLDQLPPASRFTGLRNILYAIEWWVFAAFAIFLWWRHVRDATTERPADGPGAEPADDAVVPSKP